MDDMTNLMNESSDAGEPVTTEDMDTSIPCTEETIPDPAGDTSEEDAEKTDPTEKAVSKFRQQTASRMKVIAQQLFFMKKIPEKRGSDYSREDVEKIFSYLRDEIDECEKEYLKKFDEKKADKFDFDFKF